MAGVKISALPALTTTASTDVYPTVQGGVTYKVSLAQIVDSVTSGNIARLATSGALTVTYSNGSSGVGATLTNAGALAALTIDGVACAVNDVILVKDQASTFQNGIYTVTTVGDGVTAWVMTRSATYDEITEIEAGDFFTVAFGTTNAKTQWIQTATVAIIGTDAITFQSNVIAGIGISKTNNTINATGGGLATVTIAGTSQNAAVNTQYIALNAGQTTVTLPATCAVGDIVCLVGSTANTGGWILDAPAGDTIRVLNSTTSAGGTVTSTAQAGECIEVICDVANTSWVARYFVSTVLTTA